MEQTNTTSMEALTPKEIVKKTEKTGIKKARSSFVNTFILGILGGMFVALGAMFSINTISGLAAAGLPYGIVRLFAGAVFCLWLILVIIAGGELFTGNVLLVIAWLNKKISTLQFIKNLVAVYLGNFVGSIVIVLLLFLAGFQEFGGNSTGQALLSVSIHKLDYTFIQALCMGILCNILVCLGVWLTYSCKTTGDKILAIIFPITAFAAGGFDHSVANMFYLPYAFLLKNFGSADFLSKLPENIHLEHLEIGKALLMNQLPVTIGNFIGGAVFVGFLFWLAYNKEVSKVAQENSLVSISETPDFQNAPNTLVHS